MVTNNVITVIKCLFINNKTNVCTIFSALQAFVYLKRDVTMCSLVEVHRRFGQMYCLHLHGQQEAKQETSTLCDKPSLTIRFVQF
jgi:hypothetical protein